MNYGILLAGGKGTRMGNIGIPKHFLPLQNKPIIIHTLEKMVNIDIIDNIIVVCNSNYILYLKDLVQEYNISRDVYITKGGTSRLNSVMNGLKFIEENFKIKEDDIFLAHDAVRPFISEKIIKDNIKFAKMHKAATTVVNLIETIVQEKDGKLFKAYPRENLYAGQSPQTFNIKYYIECYKKIPEEIKSTFTDLSECVMYNNGTVWPILGSRDNIKITTQFDLIVANELLKKKMTLPKN